ncbi:hypothetical protein PUN28_013019 [Cardiocondyla obscurior]|uniref:Uncharacterized protein n=1 Tax=Cardiocondyla obscurior TaxID=286306 RepID=A0AAW2F6J5_9HYME
MASTRSEFETKMSRHPCVVARFSYRIRRFETVGSIVDYLGSIVDYLGSIVDYLGSIVDYLAFRHRQNNLRKTVRDLKNLRKTVRDLKNLRKTVRDLKNLRKTVRNLKNLRKTAGFKELEKDSAGYKELEKDSAGFKELEKDSAGLKELEKDSAGNVSYHARVSFAAWCKRKDQPDIPRISREHPERRRRPRKGILPRRSNPRIKRNSAASHRLMRT